MQITCLGHAGMHIETRHGTILCDPWKNPAYFDSWFVFPDNSGLDWDHFGQVDYLYVSHLHKDHFDPELLTRHVSKDATVLLPDFPVPDLRDQLERLGFTRFQVLRGGQVVERDGLRLMVQALISPTDGPLGDSALAVDDGTARILNQNDARPTDLDQLRSFGHSDVHLLDLRPPGRGEALVRDGETGQRPRPRGPLRQGHRRQPHRAVGRAALLP
jgi:UDP-MurNAc hydroxylase